MEVETTFASPSQCCNSIPKLAFAEGGPLVIDPAFPQTLTDALRHTAAEHAQKGIHFIARDGSESFYSYPRLLERAARVAGGLRSQGLAPVTKVILQLDTLEAHYQAFWGCLLSGLVPVTIAIAPAYNERNGVVDKLYNTWLLLDKPPIITARQMSSSFEKLRSLLPMAGLKILCVEDLLEFAPADSLHAPKPADVAFIQLSSGSTGVPKCIQETHQGVIAHIHSSGLFNGYQAEDVTLNWLPVDHVVPLLTFHLKDVYLGCEQIHAPTALVLSEPLLWFDLLQSYRVTHTWAPNFAFKLASERLRLNGRAWDLSRVKFFMNAGEQVTLPVVREFLQAVAPMGVRESAMQPAFGMAEVCTCMTYANQFSVKNGARRFLKSSLKETLIPASEDSAGTVEFVGLGRVTPGNAIRITDADNQVLPEGVIGRLQIKGPVVTPGYYRNDDANHDAFVGNGWFNTGDLGFMLDDELFLTGREKEMIIIRGAKFYCYEVEDVVNGVPGVEPTFAAACGITDTATGTEKLAIFFAHSSVTDEPALVRAIRRRVTARLGIAPAYVVPLSIGQFPKTTSGKIQRTRLKQSLEAGAFDNLSIADNAGNISDSQRDRNEVEEHLMNIWREVLSVPDLQAASNLFELGGDSLKALQIISRIRERWRLEFPLPLLFADGATVEGMARWITENQDLPGHEALPAILPVPRNAGLPLSYSQFRLWLAEQIDPGTSLYNICRTVSLKGVLDPAALEQALQVMVERHEILRTVYSFEDMPLQHILPAEPVAMPRHELAHLTETERKRVVANLVESEAARPFDLATGPLLRTKLIRTGTDEHLLLVVFHQIVTDAWSLKVFFRELADAYKDLCSGNGNVSRPAPAIQYADYAAWQQRWFTDGALEDDVHYWTEKLTHPAPHFAIDLSSAAEKIPTSGRTPLGQIKCRESAIQELYLEKPLLEKLRAFNAAENITLHTTLLGAFRILLYQLTGETDVLIGSPESGRRRIETENVLGCFVNMLALRATLSPEETFRTFLAKVRQGVLDASAHANIPFEKVQAAVAEKCQARLLFQIWFGPIDSLEAFQLGSLHADPKIVFPPVAQFDLSCFVSERASAVTCFFEHKTEVLSTAAGAQWIRLYERLIAALIGSPDAPLHHILKQFIQPGALKAEAPAVSVPLGEPVTASGLTQSTA